MARKDTGAAQRLPRTLDAVAAWASTLDESQRSRPTVTGRPVGALLDRTLRRGDRLAGLTPDQALELELGLVTDALACADALGDVPPLPRPSLAAAVRTSLFRLEAEHPGHLVEVRVPPWGAVQIGMPGVNSVHRRGTPPNVVETDASTWLRLIARHVSWSDAVSSGAVSASGAHAQLGDLLAPAGC